jgi:uncharacterized membrane protein
VTDLGDITRSTFLYSAVGVLWIGLGVPLLLARVRPNSWYGCRTLKTLSDQKIWYAVNRITGRDLIITGVGVIMSTMAVFLLRAWVTSTLASIIPLAVLILGVVLMAVNSLREQRRVERGGV